MAKKATITEAQWAEARLLYSKGSKMGDLANRSGIALRTIQQNKQFHPDLWIRDEGLTEKHKEVMALESNSIHGLTEDLKYSMKALTRLLTKVANDSSSDMEDIKKARELANIIKTASGALKDLNTTELETKNKGIKKKEVNIRAESHKIDWNKLYSDANKVDNPDKFIETIIDAEYSINKSEDE